jgi:hypothetical protein
MLLNTFDSREDAMERAKELNRLNAYSISIGNLSNKGKQYTSWLEVVPSKSIQ